MVKNKPALKIELLGSLQVHVGQGVVAFRTDAERVLLAYLAVQQTVPCRRDTLTGLLSPDRPDTEALTYLRNRLSRLREAVGDDKALPPWFDIDRKQITLRAGDDVVIDVVNFHRLLDAVEAHSHRQLAGCPVCLANLQAAADLVRGELLAGLNFPSETWQMWLTTQREYVQQRALAAMSRLCEARLAQGEWPAVLEIAQRQLGMEPWLEAAHRAVMQAHYQMGNRNAALAQYALCEQTLEDELGLRPDRETGQLRQQILTKVSLGPAAAPVADNLPVQVGRFWGRAGEQALLGQRLVDPGYRLITLVGMGGVGKTRLAIESGRAVKASFPDGVWFVPLAANGMDGEQIKMLVGEVIGLAPAGQQLTGEQLLALLRGKRLLLILDNCEVALAQISFIPEWLRRAPHLAILATSREPLNFQAESVILLGGLPTGHPEPGAAEAMFGERGQMARSEFAISATNLPQVRQICDLVDGSPLGIALAAAWVRQRSLAQIIDSIRHSLDFLSTRLRDVDPRHRSMRAVFEASWQLLGEEEQAILAALSVFPASFTAQAAGRVAGAALLNLDLLSEKSLLQQQQETERYALHSLVRHFAADKLATRTPEVNQAFANYFYQFACDYGGDYAQLQAEWPNLLAAIAKAHALEAWAMVIAFVQLLDKPWFHQIRFNEMRAGLAMALEAAKALQDGATYARLLLRLGEIEMELNDYRPAEAHLAQAIQQLTGLADSLGIAQANYLFGRIKNEQAQDEQALRLFEQSRDSFAQHHDWLGVAKNLNLMAVCHVKKYRDFQTAHDYLSQAAALQQGLPFSSTYIETLRNLARVKGWTGDHQAAEICLAEAATISQQHGEMGEYAATLYERVLLGKLRHQVDEALAVGYECLEIFSKLGSLRWEGLIKTQLGLLQQTKQNRQQGVELLAEGLQIFEELGDLYEQAYSYYYLARLYGEMGQEENCLQARDGALRLNLVLNDPQLAERLRDVD